jgi:hypothetical protein
MSSCQKRIFAIVLPSIATQVRGKTIRRIVIFDNHPDSLRLILGSGVRLDSNDTASRRDKIAMLVAAVLWPLCW